MTSETFQAFTNYLYAQAQAQTQTPAGQGQFPVPHTTTFAPPPAHLIVKLFELVKVAKQLGCETFFVTVDAVATKNWQFYTDTCGMP